MSNQTHHQDRRAVVSVRTMEIIVAALLLAFGVLIASASHKLGANWAEDGPEAGYFPFYVGSIIAISSLVTLIGALRGSGAMRAAFVESGQLKLVLSVLVPAVVFALLIHGFGIYLAAVIYIAFFMIWLGNYAWWKAMALGLAVSVAAYMMFEVWFKVPLHKGSWFDPLGLIGL